MPQLPAVAWGTIGHGADEDDVTDTTAAYWFIRDGQAYVDCTLQPSGALVVARVNMADSYEVMGFGDRVLVVHSNGDPQSSTIIGKYHDQRDPLPDRVAGMQIAGDDIDPSDRTTFAKRVQFIQPRPGVVLAIETQTTGDILIHSAAGTSIKATGYVHIDGAQVVLGASPVGPPTPGEVVGEDETPAVPFTPAAGQVTAYNTNPPYAGLIDAVVRAGDQLQSTPGLDPKFFTYVTAVDVLLKAICAAGPIAAILAAPLAAYQVAVPTPPTEIKSRAKTACQRVEARS